jgi:hypothetical protein
LHTPFVRQPQVPSDRQQFGSGAQPEQPISLGQSAGPPSAFPPDEPEELDEPDELDEPPKPPPSLLRPPELELPPEVVPPEVEPVPELVPTPELEDAPVPPHTPAEQAWPRVVQSTQAPPEAPQVMSWVPAWQVPVTSQQPLHVPPSPHVPVPVPLLPP